MDYKKIASKGRGGDTLLRHVDGYLSHVNRDEALLIDLLGKYGEDAVSKDGAGTINPTTGLPEYTKTMCSLMDSQGYFPGGPPDYTPKKAEQSKIDDCAMEKGDSGDYQNTFDPGISNFNQQSGMWNTPGGETFTESGFDPKTGWSEEEWWSVESLGFKDVLGSEAWEKHKFSFDPYDPTEEHMFKFEAGEEKGQLQESFNLQKRQMTENVGLERQQLGAQARTGLTQARTAGEAGKRKSGMAYSGTAEEMQRGGEADIMQQYGMGMQAGETAYSQALEAGQFKVDQGFMDIEQQQRQDIWGLHKDWESQQRDTLNMLLGRGIGSAEGTASDEGATITEEEREQRMEDKRNSPVCGNATWEDGGYSMGERMRICTKSDGTMAHPDCCEPE